MPLEVVGKYRYPPFDPSWLARHEEAPLEPDMPIIDAHHHLWDEPGHSYHLSQLVEDISTSGHRIVATVYVQAQSGYRTAGPEYLRCIGETEHVEVQQIAARKSELPVRICAGIVAFADLRDLVHLDEVLELHAAASTSFRGVRQSMARDSHFPDGIVLRPAPAGMLSDPAMREGIRRLGQRNLSFDALVYHEQLAELLALARAVPHTMIVLNHYGCPIGVGPYAGRERETFAAWRRDIRALSECENIKVKLGGLGMIITGAQYHLQVNPPTSEQLANDWHPWIETCVEAFGTGRCMFESNFPVDKAMYSYGVLWNAFKRITGALSIHERSDLFFRTAAITYRLKEI